MGEKKDFEDRLKKSGVSRRDFLKFCTTVAGALGLGPVFGTEIMEALAAPDRPPILWLHFAECTGCTEAALRTTYPWFDELILDNVSLDYHETLMAASGSSVVNISSSAAAQYTGQFFCVVEGAIPTANSGIYGTVGGRTMLTIARDICVKAQAVIAIGTCASYGGLAAAAPNPTGAKGVKAALGSRLTVPLINLPGCPPNPVNVVGTIANYLLVGKLPDLDSVQRPLFAYGQTVHSQCPFNEDRGGDEDRCLRERGCKGPECHHNCPKIQFYDGTNWCVGANHPCIGCAEPNFWDTMTPFYQGRDDD